jgi:uncharacterized membrane protein
MNSEKWRKVMKKNVGSVDKTIRIIVGIVLLIVGIFVQMSTGFRIGTFAVAAIVLITATIGF